MGCYVRRWSELNANKPVHKTRLPQYVKYCGNLFLSMIRFNKTLLALLLIKQYPRIGVCLFTFSLHSLIQIELFNMYKLRTVFSLLLFSASFLFPQLAKASAYWMEIHGSGKIKDPVTIQMCYGFIDDLSERHRTTGAEFQEIKNFSFFILNDIGEKVKIELQPKEDHWEASFTPNKEGTYRILGINYQQPVLVRSKNQHENVRPIDFMCGIYQIGTRTENITPAQFMDISVQEKNGIYTIFPYRNMKPVEKGTMLRIFNPENWEKNIPVDENHKAVFKPTMPGLYVIRQDWHDTTPGTFQGIPYGKIRYRNNFCLWINPIQ